MFFFVVIILLAGGACLLVQDLLPVISWLQFSTTLLLPMLMFVSASMVPFPVMLLLAALFGLAWDLSDLVIVANTEGLGLGISMFLFAVFGAVMQGVRPMFRKGRWEVPLVLSAVVFFLYLLSSYLVINVRKGNFYFPPELWLKLGLTTALSIVVAPMMFYALYRLAAWCGNPLDLAERRRR